MRQEVEREIELDAEPADVWRELTESDWLGDDPVIELEPGGDLEFTDRDEGRRTGWVEEVEPERRLTVWWSGEGEEESSRVEFEIVERERRQRAAGDRDAAAGRPDRAHRDGAGVSLPVDDREQVFDALADPTRRRMLSVLGERETATATELAAELPVTRQAVAKHLAALAAVGLVEPTRKGREVRYRLTPEPLSGAMAWMATVGGRWDSRLDDLRKRLGE